MGKKQEFILWFKDIGIGDVALVGGKNAALGEMFSNLNPLGINIPNGFAITARAYNYFLDKAGLKDGIRKELEGLDTHDVKDLQKRGECVRNMILSSVLPVDLKKEITSAYEELGKLYPHSRGAAGARSENLDVAVRSSATAEDLPGASFAGQQETYLNISGVENVLAAVKKCIASLFTNRAISYRVDKGFSHFDVSLSVGVQKMVRSDLASSGVAFSIDTETGFDKVVVINGSFGLGETVVQGQVTPDEFIVFKPTLKQGFKAIIAKDLGKKDIKLIYAASGTKKVKTTKEERSGFCLSDGEVLRLGEWTAKIEDYFSQKHARFQPMDVEWAKDGKTQELFIVQARPETIHATREQNVYKEYRLLQKGQLLLSGTAVGTKIAVGKVRVLKDARAIGEFQKGEILVTEMTDPDWEPIMKIAQAIVTEKGGRTSHAAIVSRELGIPCIVGAEGATRLLKDGEDLTIDCSSGVNGLVYDGKLEFEVVEHRLDKIPETKTKVAVNIGSPDEAFKNHYLPVKGVGLGRLEFIITSHIKIHPNVLIDYDKLKSEIRNPKSETNSKFKAQNSKLKKLINQIDALTAGYTDKKQFYIDELSEGIAKIGAAFWPNEVIIRFSDFKTNEYRALLGGELYEPQEQNPMIGWRGASRYYDPKFKEAFGLECKALKKVREEMGLKNVVAMIPFCRTPEEGRKVLAIMNENGLFRVDPLLKKSAPRQSASTFKVYVMCEIPSNVVLADAFLEIFDGMSIGSNDLTQLALGLDRDSDTVNHIANENNPAVKRMIAEVVAKCRAKGKYVGICGQAPSDYPEFAAFLVETGIESMSLNPDSVIKTLLVVAQKEEEYNKGN